MDINPTCLRDKHHEFSDAALVTGIKHTLEIAD